MTLSLFAMFDPTLTQLSLNFISFCLMVLAFPDVFSGAMYPTLTSKVKLFVAAELTPNFKGKMVSQIMLFLTIFLMLFTCNLSSLLPFVFSVTSHLKITLVLALVFWVSFLLGKVLSSKLLLSHLTPYGTPLPLAPLMVIIETISLLIQPLTLAIRLMANMTAGHLIMALISATLPTLAVMGGVGLMVELLLLMLELMVSLIQAYVFTTLLSLYSQG